MSKLNKAVKAVKDGTFKKALQEFSWICNIAKKYNRVIAGFIVLNLVLVIFGSVLGLSVGDLVNYFADRNIKSVASLAAFYVVFGIFNIILAMVKNRVEARILNRVKRDLTMDSFGVLLRSKWESMASYHSGDIMTRLDADIKSVSENISTWIPSLIMNTFQLIVAVAVIVYYDASMLVLIIAVMPIIFIGSEVFLKKLYESNQKQRKFAGTLMSFNKETLHNIQAIKAFGLDEMFYGRRKKLEDTNYDLGLEVNKYSIGSWGTTYFCTQMAAAVCLIWTGYRVITGVISIGDLAVLFIFAMKVSSSAKALLGLIPGGMSAVTAAARVREIMALPEEEKVENEAFYDEMLKLAEETGASVEIDNVDFSYINGNKVFDNVSIVACPGEMVALVGPSGEGKTTMLRLILGLITQQSGETRIRVGNNVMEMNAATRRFISYVPQGNTMMNGTIAENLRITRPDATDKEIISALKGACAYEFVSALPDGINHNIGESGIGFSEGQNQRLAIARALMNPSPILLLDEATSALDVATERKVLNNLMNHKNIRTCILTTHRPTVLGMCDKVYRIAAKKVRIIGEEEIQQLMNDF